jgi:hypothetical protein
VKLQEIKEKIAEQVQKKGIKRQGNLEKQKAHTDSSGGHVGV